MIITPIITYCQIKTLILKTFSFTDEFCSIENPTPDCVHTGPQITQVDDEYLAKLEAEIKVLKAMKKGFTSTIPDQEKSNTCPNVFTALHTFFELLRNPAWMCSVEKLLMD